MSSQVTMNVEHVRLVVKSSITVVSFFVTYIYIYICAILDISCSFFFPFFLSYDFLGFFLFLFFFFLGVYECAVRCPVCGTVASCVYIQHTHLCIYINNSLTNRRERRRKKNHQHPERGIHVLVGMDDRRRRRPLDFFFFFFLNFWQTTTPPRFLFGFK